MAQTLYASFTDASLAEKAAGALMDFGVKPEEISLVSNEAAYSKRDYTAHSATLEERRSTDTYEHGNRVADAGGSAWDATKSAGDKMAEGGDRLAAGVSGSVGADNTSMNYETAADERNARAGERWNESRTEGSESIGTDRTYSTDYTDRDTDSDKTDADKTEKEAKYGISTTTPGDAAAGAAKGAGIGLGLGALAALASLMVPGVGLVVGGGALATALAGAAGATAAGAVAGGVHGYLKDQGVPDHIAADYNKAVENGGAVMSINISNSEVTESEVRQILNKYGAGNIGTYGATAY
jgi:hypothetical protein